MNTSRDITPRIVANEGTKHASCSCLQLSEDLQKLISEPELYVRQMWNEKISETDLKKLSKELRRDADRFFTWLPLIENITFQMESSIIIKFSNGREIRFHISQEMYYHLRKTFFK